MPHIHEKIDFTVSAFIVYKNKVLLIDHIKLKTWLPVGGHIELDEDPEQALFREIEEECGIKKSQLTVLSSKPDFNAPGTKFLFTPNFLDIHKIDGKHRHVGLIYFLKSDTVKIVLKPDEHSNIKWFGKKDLENKVYKLQPQIIYYAKKALSASRK